MNVKRQPVKAGRRELQDNDLRHGVQMNWSHARRVNVVGAALADAHDSRAAEVTLSLLPEFERPGGLSPLDVDARDELLEATRLLGRGSRP